MSADPPEGSQNAKPSRPKRNVPSFRPTNRSIPDLISDPANKSAIIDEQTARAELEGRLFITPAAEINIDTLTTALLDFTVQAHSLTPMHIDIIRAIAILLFKADHEKKTKHIAESVTSLLEGSVNRLEEIAKTQTNKEDNGGNTDSFTEKAEEAINAVNNSLKDIKNNIDHISPTIKKLQDNLTSSTSIENRLDKIHQDVSNLNAQVKQISQQGSYKAALLTGLRNSDDPISQDVQRAARVAIKARQILININPESPLAPGKSLHSQLVEKIKNALKTLVKTDTPDLELRSVTQYQNGGTIIEMIEEEAAAYIKRQRTSRSWNIRPIRTSDPSDPKSCMYNKYHDRAYPVIIQFVPLTFNPSDQTQIQDVEQENKWEPGTITSAKWVKPPSKHSPSQRVAHLLITLKDPNTANIGIRDGITINQNKLQLKKNKREPIRCTKCQRYGHIARDCIQHHDTCANCAEEHRTSECTNKDLTRCVSCKTDDHASWARTCPELERRCTDLDSRDQGNTMPYYPTNEDWTQVQAPPKSKPYIRTQPSHPPAPTQQSQNTLDHHLAPRGSRNMRGCNLPSNARVTPFRQSNSPPPPSQYRPYRHRSRSRSHSYSQMPATAQPPSNYFYE
ncbi:hypothetical protein C8R48DRAFT_660903 [Suillus tomentosus]|nr:hypothetical protein C8R48DRAFT_660903 [Suillus tomentosus]